MSEARTHILERLRANRIDDPPPADAPLPAPDWSQEQCIARFSERQRAVHGEVHRVARDGWMAWLARELPERGLHRLLVGTGAIGRQLVAEAHPGIEARPYDQPIEAWKPALFGAFDAALTGTRCAVAETGSLVLWPDADEPRLMSLVPPVHIALLEAERLHSTFAHMIEVEHWAGRMPTNALLISGPSKTADIEQTLAYGIHGPKQLITLILE